MHTDTAHTNGAAKANLKAARKAAEAKEEAAMDKAEEAARKAKAEETARKAKAEKAHEANKRQELAIKVQALGLALSLAQELRPLGVALIAAQHAAIVKGSERKEARLDKFAAIEAELLSRLVTATSPEELREVGRKLNILTLLREPPAPHHDDEE